MTRAWPTYSQVVFADDTVDNSTLSELMGKDQNGNPRITASDGFSDSGAVEILWVRFNANGGNWTGLEANTYAGADYYNLEDGKTSLLLQGYQ